MTDPKTTDTAKDFKSWLGDQIMGMTSLPICPARDRGMGPSLLDACGN